MSCSHLKLNIILYILRVLLASLFSLEMSDHELTVFASKRVIEMVVMIARKIGWCPCSAAGGGNQEHERYVKSVKLKCGYQIKMFVLQKSVRIWDYFLVHRATINYKNSLGTVSGLLSRVPSNDMLSLTSKLNIAHTLGFNHLLFFK